MDLVYEIREDEKKKLHITHAKPEQEKDGNTKPEVKKKKKQLEDYQYFLWYHEIEQIILAADNLRDKTIIEVLAFEGMRREEATHLRAENIEWGRGRIHLVHTKGSKERTIAMHPRVEQDLKLLLGNRRKGYVFLNNSGKKLSERYVNIITKKYGEKAGIDNPNPRYKSINPHLFRHSFAHEWLRKNPGDFDGLMMFLGHSNINTTLMYGKKTVREMEANYTNMWKRRKQEKIC